MPKIIQILVEPESPMHASAILGLGDDGAVYIYENHSQNWKTHAPALDPRPVDAAGGENAPDGPTLPSSHHVKTSDGIWRELDWRDGVEMFRNLWRGEHDAKWEVWMCGRVGCRAGDEWFEANKPLPRADEPIERSVKLGGLDPIMWDDKSGNGNHFFEAVDKDSLTAEGGDALEMLIAWESERPIHSETLIESINAWQSERDEATARAEKADAKVRELEEAREKWKDLYYKAEAELDATLKEVTSIQSEVTRLTAMAEEARCLYMSLRSEVGQYIDAAGLPVNFETSMRHMLDRFPPWPATEPTDPEEQS